MNLPGKFLSERYEKSLVFWVLLILTGFLYSYIQLLNEDLIGTHLWRQSDCLSITMNYYQHGMNFFQPELHNQLVSNDSAGNSAGEFPLWYYINALVWKIVGPQEFTYRILAILLSFTGLFAFFRLLLHLFRNDWIAFILPLLMFSSPVYAIYGISYLTDVPAFSISLIAWYSILLYFLQGKQKWLWAAMILFGLAGLLKVSSLIGFTFLALCFFIEKTGTPLWKGRFLFRKTPVEIIAFALVPVLIVSWYLYAKWYNNLYGGSYTFNSVWTYFDLRPEEQRDYLGNLRDHMLYAFYSKSMLFLLLFTWIANFFLLHRIPRFIALAAVFIPLGVGIYFLLWSAAFRNHDYYFVPMLYLVPAIFIPFLYGFKKTESSIWQLKPLKILALVFLAYNILYCGSYVFMRHYGHRGEFIIAGPSESVFINKYAVIDYNKNWKSFEMIKPFLSSKGVEPDHKVICPSDFTINGSLYLMNRKGWTGYQQWPDHEAIMRRIRLGASWLVIHGEQLPDLEAFHDFALHQAGKHNNLLLFDLRPFQEKNPLNQQAE